jgi:hypothetical protein
MKRFNEWLKERNAIEEAVADYTPGFIRKPLQNMGLMGQTSREKADSDEWERKMVAQDAEEKSQANSYAKQRNTQSWDKDPRYKVTSDDRCPNCHGHIPNRDIIKGYSKCLTCKKPVWSDKSQQGYAKDQERYEYDKNTKVNRDLEDRDETNAMVRRELGISSWGR